MHPTRQTDADVPAGAVSAGREGAASPLLPFLAELMDDQQRLQTPVAEFARAHATATRSDVAPPPRLIPLTAPKPGEQYAFEVSLDACTGCKSCVAACHSLNGLDEQETWRDVGLLVAGSARHPFTQTVTSACHHCTDPACLNGCPVLAYEKDPLTGIVRHLDDQCIGCSYCVLKCPYDVPKYSARLGIVRKCDMCHGRLAQGEPPACAQACPTHAIRIVTVAVDAPNPFLPAAPDPAYTRPTTRYVSNRPLPPDVAAADASTARVQPAHWPLVVLLTLMPMAAGASVATALGTVVPQAAPASGLSVVAWLTGAAGLAASIAHLGQPLRAWRVFLGLRTSWLSREAVGFGAWFAGATATAATAVLPIPTAPLLRVAIALGTAIVGLAALLCSAALYIDTRRRFWAASHTLPRFLGTMGVLGTATALFVGIAAHSPGFSTPGWCMGFIGALVLKLAVESRALAPLSAAAEPAGEPQVAARLLSGPLRSVNEARIAVALVAGLLAGALVAKPAVVIAGAMLLAAMIGEFLERSLYFRAVDAPKMPGNPSAPR